VLLREADSAAVTLCQSRYDHASSDSQQGTGCAVLECVDSTEDSTETTPIDILDAQFFDDELLVIVYRALSDGEGEQDGE
jgi:hypothetical protein